MSRPDTPPTLRMIREMQDDPNNVERWQTVPFPSRIHAGQDCVYTIDQDAGVFIYSVWGERRMVDTRGERIDLASIYETSDLVISNLLEQAEYLVHHSTSWMCEAHCDAVLT